MAVAAEDRRLDCRSLSFKFEVLLNRLTCRDVELSSILCAMICDEAILARRQAFDSIRPVRQAHVARHDSARHALFNPDVRGGDGRWRSIAERAGDGCDTLKGRVARESAPA